MYAINAGFDVLPGEVPKRRILVFCVRGSVLYWGKDFLPVVHERADRRSQSEPALATRVLRSKTVTVSPRRTARLNSLNRAL
jgi:hypothetical protein